VNKKEYATSTVDKLEKVQKKATKIIIRENKLTDENRLKNLNYQLLHIGKYEEGI